MSDIIKSEQFAEHHLLDHISISRSSHISVIDIQTELNISDIFAEYHLLDYTSISGPNYISVPSALNIDIYIKADRVIVAIYPSLVKLLISKDIDIKTKMFVRNINVEPCLPHQGILISISYFLVTSSFNMSIIVEKEENIKKIRISNIHLLGDIDINIKAERFIRTFHSSYINLIKDVSREAPSEHHLWILKSHQGSIIGISCLFVTSSLIMNILVEKKKFIKNIVTIYSQLALYETDHPHYGIYLIRRTSSASSQSSTTSELIDSSGPFIHSTSTSSKVSSDEYHQETISSRRVIKQHHQ